MSKLQSGFTLIELLISISLLITISFIAAPNFQKSIEDSDANTSIESIYQAWQLAKTLSLQQGRSIYICGSDDGKNCTKEWSKFLIIFDDHNRDFQPDTDEILYRQTIQSPTGRIQTRIAFGKPYTTINSRGRASFTGSFLYCNNTKDRVIERKVTWNLAARLYLTGSHLNRSSASTVHC